MFFLPKMRRDPGGRPRNPFAQNQTGVFSTQGIDSAATAYGSTAGNLFIPDVDDLSEQRLSLPTPFAAPLRFAQRLEEALAAGDAVSAEEGEWRALIALIALGNTWRDLPVRLACLSLDGEGPFARAMRSYLERNAPEAAFRWPEKDPRTERWNYPLTLVTLADEVVALLNPATLVAPAADCGEHLAALADRLPCWLVRQEAPVRLRDPLAARDYHPRYQGGHALFPRLNWLECLQLRCWLARARDELAALSERGQKIGLAGTLLARYQKDLAALIAASFSLPPGAAELPWFVEAVVTADVNECIRGGLQVGAFLQAAQAAASNPQIALRPLMCDEAGAPIAPMGEAHALYELLNCACRAGTDLWIEAMASAYAGAPGARAGEGPDARRGITQRLLEQAAGRERGIFQPKLILLRTDGACPLPYASDAHRLNDHLYGLLPLRREVLEELMAFGAPTAWLADVAWSEEGATGVRVRVQLRFSGGTLPLSRRYDEGEIVYLAGADLRSLGNAWVWPAQVHPAYKAYFVVSRAHSAPGHAFRALRPLQAPGAAHARHSANGKRLAWQLPAYPWFLSLELGADAGFVCAWNERLGVPAGAGGGELRTDIAVDFGSSSSIAFICRRNEVLKLDAGMLSRRLLSNGDPEAPAIAMREFFPEEVLPGASEAERLENQVALSRIPSALVEYDNGNVADSRPILDYGICFDNIVRVQADVGATHTDLKWGANEHNARARTRYIELFIALCALYCRAKGFSSIERWYLGHPSSMDGHQVAQFREGWREQLQAVAHDLIDAEGGHFQFGQEIVPGQEGLATANFFRNTGVMTHGHAFAAIDIGGSTTDIAVYDRDHRRVCECSIRFAGRNLLLGELLRLPNFLNLLLGAHWNANEAHIRDLARQAPQRVPPLEQVRAIRAQAEVPGFFDNPLNVMHGWYAVDGLLRWFVDEFIDPLMGRGRTLVRLLRDALRDLDPNHRAAHQRLAHNLRVKLMAILHVCGHLMRACVAEESLHVALGGNGSRIAFWCDPDMIEDFAGVRRIGGSGEGRLVAEHALRGGEGAAEGAPFSCVLSREPKQEVAQGLVDLAQAAAGGQPLAAPDARQWFESFWHWLEEARQAHPRWLAGADEFYRDEHRNILLTTILNDLERGGDFGSAVTACLERLDTLLPR